jgi:CheY-like chemotaxis protein
MIRGQAGAHTVRITSKKGAIMTAYVIDNHPIMSDQIAMVIRRIKPGLKVVSVRTIDDLNCAVISGGPPEIICTDLELPVSFGISGIKTLRKKFPNTRLAVITGSDPNPYETECRNAGAPRCVFLWPYYLRYRITSSPYKRMLLVMPSQ